MQTLSSLSNSTQIVPTSVEFVDIAGLVKGASKGEGLGNQFLANIRECDAIAQVQAASSPAHHTSLTSVQEKHPLPSQHHLSHTERAQRSLSSSLLSGCRCVQVVRCFEDKNVIHVAGKVDPVEDIDVINFELALSDITQIEKRLERIAKGRAKTKEEIASNEVWLCLRAPISVKGAVGE